MRDIAIRLLLAVVMAGALFGAYHSWATHQQDIGYNRARTEFAMQAKKADDKREAVSAPIEAEHQAAEAKIVTVTKTIIKEVPRYVKDTDCPMPPGFRLLHDAAAANVPLPDPARIADAAPAAAADVATTVASNYGLCAETAQRLSDLQSWVKAQQDLK